MDYAGFWRRVAALLIDSIVMGIVGVFIGRILMVIFGGDTQPAGIYAWDIGNWSAIPLSVVYHTLMETSPFKGSIGKIVFYIQVTDLQGNTLTKKQAALRNCYKILSFVTLLIGFFMAGFTKQKQALHDKLTHSLVIKKPGHPITY